VQVVGALLRHGPQRLEGLRQELAQWLLEHDHATARELIGTMSQERCPDPAEYERAQYMRAIQTYNPSEAALAPGPW
jgi:dihydroorotate dehydrogenase (fumarate)